MYTEASQPSTSIKNMPQRLGLTFCLGQMEGVTARNLCRIASSRDFTAIPDFVQYKTVGVEREK